MANIIQQLDAEQMQRALPEFGPGDTVVVQVKVKEGARERLQALSAKAIAAALAAPFDADPPPAER